MELRELLGRHPSVFAGSCVSRAARRHEYRVRESPPVFARYAAVLAAPHVPPLVITDLLHGLATAPLALVLLVAERSGSYAGAGVVSASYMVSNGAVAPLWGRCVDRLGPTRVLLRLAVGPITTTIFGLLDEIVPAAARTEAFTWVITAFAAGIAIGLTLGGTLHEAAGTDVALLSAAAAALLELAVLIARRGTLGRSMNGV